MGDGGTVRSVVVEADGGSRGNPGTAGFGALVLDAGDVDGPPLGTVNEAIGRATNNVAEYRALIAGLTEARRLGATDVLVRMDSRLVVEQMAGRWQVKNADLAVLRERATTIAREFDHIDYEWIPRARNSRADALANAAMDRAEDSGAGTASTSTATSGTAATAVTPTSTAAPSAPAAAPTAWTGRDGAPTRLILLRHGQTELSIERRYSGRGNPRLTELGHRQARGAAHRLAGDAFTIDAIVASPLARTLATAEAVAGKIGLPVSTDDGFIETDFGKWEGLTFREAREQYPDLHDRWVSDTSVPPPAGESFDSAGERVAAALAALTERYAGKTVLVVSHVTPIKLILRQALAVGPSLLFRLHLDLASLSIADFYPDGGATVRLVNDTAHLDPIG
ncbi:bifunctional RNase H/acid phosphatase [Millisia brevis]|uniref:bifunctional RNase H/acid phosphatase n=1 Tax=Millisia brevis TaxID=264148 RepID=UPI00083702C6|nr:bifunctional RNase H/acid phosphatase [Millisia brevis]